LPGITDQLQQFITVFRFAVEKLAENEEKNPFLLFTVSLLCELSSLMAFVKGSLVSSMFTAARFLSRRHVSQSGD
jgi:hypothetical protein